MRQDTPWGTWDAIGPADVAALMRGYRGWWCIAGGYAIDAFCGVPGRRDHGDIDIGLLAREQAAAHAHLAAWELQCADPPGTLRPWLPGETLPAAVHDIWARRHAGDAWRFQLMLNPADGDDWLYRRNPRLRRSLGSLTWTRDGIPYLAAEVQLLFKARGTRNKDRQDFEDTLPLLDGTQRAWLRDALRLTEPGSAWIATL